MLKYLASTVGTVAIMLAGTLGLTGAGQAASDFPTKPITLLVGFGAGGGTDVVSRKIAAEMEKVLGQPVVVVNKPGGGGLVSWKALVASEPDGYTMLIASFPHAVARFLYPSLSYDLVAGFAPVTLIGLTPNIMVVPNS